MGCSITSVAATTWSIDILRQGDWDLWVMVCAAAALVLLIYAILGRLWHSPRGWIALPLVVFGIAGTSAIIAIPSLHNRFVGLIWTFLLFCLLSATFYLNLLPQLGAARTSALLGMRILALAMLVSMFFEPVLRFITRPKPDIPLHVLIDTSGSMSFPDVQNGPTRIQSVWQTLRPQLPKIEGHFVPRYFAFSTGLDELKKPDELSRRPADGKSTDIGSAITGLVQQTTGLRSQEAVFILISDGIDNSTPNVADQARALGRKIHTVRIGSEQAEPAALANVAIDNVETADDFVVHHESKVKITVKSSALANRVVEVRMAEVDGEGRPAGRLASKALVLQPLPEGQTLELPFKPERVGVQRLAVWVDPIAGERSTVDNRQEFQGLALDPRIKVLYIEGRVRPEYTQLNRALARDPNIEVASMLRITQDRFNAAGTVNGGPVSALPASAEEWKKFDVIILGDMDSSFLTRIQQLAIEQRTAAGGGLLMIGGQNSFGPGGYEGTSIEKALPVFTGPLSSAQERSPFVPALTADGLAHPAMEGLDRWFARSGAATQPTDLPPLRGNVVVARPKSGASVLLTHANRPGPDGQPQIILATQRYGQGRSAAFTADTTYLWYIPLRGMGQESPYNRFWGQLIRWLAGEEVRNRSRGPGVDGLLNKSLFQLGESVKIRAMVRDQRGDATRYAQVNVMMKRDRSVGAAAAAGTSETQFPLAPVESRTGLYEVNIPNPDKGDWIIELSASKDGQLLGRQELKFTVIPPAEELLKIAANPKLLRDIADRTAGYHYELAQLPNLIDQLIRSDRATPRARQETISLANLFRAILTAIDANPAWPTRWDLPLQAALVLSLLATEWILRRRWQLP